MKGDIRRQTAIIIRRNGEYLVGRDIVNEGLRWSNSPYDAWRTREREKAEKIARRTGGIMVLFNPVAGQIRVMGA